MFLGATVQPRPAAGAHGGTLLFTVCRGLPNSTGGDCPKYLLGGLETSFRTEVSQGP